MGQGGLGFGWASVQIETDLVTITGPDGQAGEASRSSSDVPSLTTHCVLVVIVRSSAVCWSVVLLDLRRCFVCARRKKKRMPYRIVRVAMSRNKNA